MTPQDRTKVAPRAVTKLTPKQKRDLAEVLNSAYMASKPFALLADVRVANDKIIVRFFPAPWSYFIFASMWFLKHVLRMPRYKDKGEK